MADDGMIVVRGAREHNLKNLDIAIPRNRLVVLTGVSGSGKSSLAFDTIFAEGQRRYVESLSAYARQFLGQLNKPDVDAIEGLSPAIAIDQKSGSRNPRSTVGTVTEIYDFLRLLFARVGRPHCPDDGLPLERYSAQQIIDTLLSLPDGTRLLLLAPLAADVTGDQQTVLDQARRQGFVRVRINGDVRDLDDTFAFERGGRYTIDAVVDRLIIRHAGGAELRINDHPDRSRVADSVETALKLGGGTMSAQVVGGQELRFSERYACPVHGPLNIGALEPRDFSFNSPNGACPTCGGLGVVEEVDPDLVLPDRSLSLADGAVVPWREVPATQRRYYEEVLESLADYLSISLEVPVRDLPPAAVATLLYGSDGDIVPVRYTLRGTTRQIDAPFEGVIPGVRRRRDEADDEKERAQVAQFLTPRTCPTCNGARLRPEVLAVTVGGQNIARAAALPIERLQEWLAALGHGEQDERPWSRREQTIAAPILREIRSRLAFLSDVGLAYLSLDRSAVTLSGGEMQRIRLATQIGAGLSGVLYVLDEPSVGLHPRDTRRLLGTLLRLRDLGNSVLVVEHDEETIRAADWLIDIGPGAGPQGGELLAQGTIDDIIAAPRSLTGQFLGGKRRIPVPRRRRSGGGQLIVQGASEHNLKNIDAIFPLGTLICVTGVSGSGKSTLVNDVLYNALAQFLYNARTAPGAHRALLGADQIDKVIAVDQSPIGRTPRSNPATYARIFDPIRQLFAQTNEAKARGYDAGRFSFNVKGGRCEYCRGEGLIQVEMQFLPDLFVPCEVCGGTRYNRETLDIRFRGQTIADVLAMTAEEAAAFFERVPAIRERAQAMVDVGLGYMRLGQPATTISGGEAQRIKLAAELGKRATGRTLYVMDEPTTGLHFADTERLLGVLQRLVDAGNTMLLIEHNMDVIKSADWLIDIGPEGGSGGGQVIAMGTPEQVAQSEQSFTGALLKPLLARKSR